MANLTRALMGLWIFHHSMGGGGVEKTPISAPRYRRAKRKNVVRKFIKNHSETTLVIFKLRSQLKSPDVKMSNLTKMVFRQYLPCFKRQNNDFDSIVFISSRRVESCII